MPEPLAIGLPHIVPAVPQDVLSHLIDGFLQTIAKTIWDAVVNDLLSVTFGVFDKYGTPNVLPNGPLLSGVLPITLWLGLFVATLMSLVQIGRGVIRGGRGLGELLVGVAQYALLTAGALGVLNLLIGASNSLALGILKSGLNIDNWVAIAPKFGVGNKLVNGLAPFLLIVLTLVLYLPAALFLLFEVLFRYAALAVLAATTPILAAGLVSEFTKRWFYTGLRWVIALLLMEPAIALVLVIGYQGAIGAAGGNGVTDGAISSLVGLVVFSFMIIIALVCPIALFKLLAFVDPNTMSGVRVRNVLGGVGGHDAAGGQGRGGGGRDPVGAGGQREPASDGGQGGDAMDPSQNAASSRLNAAMASVGAAGERANRVMPGVISAGGQAAEQASRSYDAWGVGHPGAVINQAQPAQRSSSGAGGQQDRDEQPQDGGGPDDPNTQGPTPSASPSPVMDDSGPPSLPSAEVIEGEVIGSGPSTPLALSSTPSSPGMGGDIGGGWPSQVRMPSASPSSPRSGGAEGGQPSPSWAGGQPSSARAESQSAHGGGSGPEAAMNAEPPQMGAEPGMGAGMGEGMGSGAAAGASGAEAMEMAVVLL